MKTKIKLRIKTIKLEIQGGGNTSRSFIFIDDFTDALILSSKN